MPLVRHVRLTVLNYEFRSALNQDSMSRISSKLLCIVLGIILVALAQAQDNGGHSARLIERLNSQSVDVCIVAIQECRENSELEEEIIDLLRNLAKGNANPEVRENAVVTLHACKRFNDLSFIVDILNNDKDLAVRLAASRALKSGNGSESVNALIDFSSDLAASNDFSAEIRKWIGRIGLVAVFGIVVIIIASVIRYIVFRDLRRSLMTSALAFAFLPQFGLTFLAIYFEYWLYGPEHGTGIITIATSVVSALVIIAAMYFIDKQDSRRHPLRDDSEWEILAESLEQLCGRPIGPKSLVMHLVGRYEIPKSFVDQKGLGEADVEKFNVGVRDVLSKILDNQIQNDADAVNLLLNNVTPFPIRQYDAQYLLMRAKQNLIGP